ncbi:MAG: hypothetical protein HAW63_01740 [Bdellovibrionaceae bacterium]|nr:hypothetical protein [Pseudobdellovibrionaceae bacterium]
MTADINNDYTLTPLFLLEKNLFLLGFTESNLKQLEVSFHKVFCDYFALDNFSISLDGHNLANTKSTYYINLSLQNSKQKIRLKFLKRNGFSEENIFHLKKIKKSINVVIAKVFSKSQKKELFNQWKLIFDSISTPLCLTDKTAKIYTANQKYLEHSKQTQDLLIGADAFEMFFKAHFAHYKIINKSAKNNFNVFEIQGVKNKTNTNFEKNTTYYYEVLNQNFKINTHSQEDISLYFFRDISQQKKIEKELLTQSQKVELGLISSSIAHELNNPVGSMLIYIDLVLQQIEEVSPLKEDLLEIRKAILKCSEIIKHLLSFAKK